MLLVKSTIVSHAFSQVLLHALATHPKQAHLERSERSQLSEVQKNKLLKTTVDIGEPPWDFVEGPQYLHDFATNAIPRMFPTFGFIFNHAMSEVLHALAPVDTSLNDFDFAPYASRLVQVGEATAAEVRRLM